MAFMTLELIFVSKKKNKSNIYFFSFLFFVCLLPSLIN